MLPPPPFQYIHESINGLVKVPHLAGWTPIFVQDWRCTSNFQRGIYPPAPPPLQLAVTLQNIACKHATLAV